jgi:hypothetical protein
MPAEISNATEQEALALRTAEFSVLRRTIAARGTVRSVIAPVTCTAWAALTLGVLLYADLPAATLLSLAVLVGGFEAVHALHVGVERIGRYLQVFYEGGPAGPQWETTAMSVGPALPGGGVDPLFSTVFVMATLLNLGAAALVPQPTWSEFAFLAAFHVAFVFRVVRARMAATRQRAVELESFKALRNRPNH